MLELHGICAVDLFPDSKQQISRSNNTKQKSRNWKSYTCQPFAYKLTCVVLTAQVYSDGFAVPSSTFGKFRGLHQGGTGRVPPGDSGGTFVGFLWTDLLRWQLKIWSNVWSKRRQIFHVQNCQNFGWNFQWLVNSLAFSAKNELCATICNCNFSPIKWDQQRIEFGLIGPLMISTLVFFTVAYPATQAMQKTSRWLLNLNHDSRFAESAHWFTSRGTKERDSKNLHKTFTRMNISNLIGTLAAAPVEVYSNLHHWTRPLPIITHLGMVKHQGKTVGRIMSSRELGFQLSNLL